MPSRLPTALVMLLPLVLSACGGKILPDTAYNDSRYRGPGAGNGSIFGPNGLSFTTGGTAAANRGGAIGVNAYLWRGALDTLSFMPLASADPFGGVIITDWYQPPASPNERFKATAYILGQQLRTDGLRVVLYRQVRQNGQWVDAQVDPAVQTALENRVLDRARQLRTLSKGAG
ncbi:MAG: DUF3576 domain-containing protein [Rhodospirillales bacterium]|nr:DUF3576 domain-containing protein [Rhodospirillales bacterium]